MTAGFVLTLSSWFAPPINSFVHSVRVIGPATLIAGFIFMVLSCLVCAVKKGKCCALCYYFILRDKFGPQCSEDPETSLPLHTELETFFKRKPTKAVDEISVSSCKLGKNRIVSAAEKENHRTLRAASLTELGKTSSPRKKMKGYRQLLEEDTMSLSDSHLAGACNYENGGKSLHISVLTKQSSKHTKAFRPSTLPQHKEIEDSCEQEEFVEQGSLRDTRFEPCFSYGATAILPAQEASVVTSLGNVSQCMCNCGDISQVGHSQPTGAGTGGSSNIVHSCQDINNLFHLGSMPGAIQSSTIDDLRQFPGMKTTHLT